MRLDICGDDWRRWRGNDIVFSTEDCLVCALPVKSERRARPTRADPLTWVLRTPTPLHGMRPHPQIRHGPFFAVSADMRVLQVPNILSDPLNSVYPSSTSFIPLEATVLSGFEVVELSFMHHSA